MAAVCRPRERLTKGTKASDSTSVQEKAASPALTPVPNSSVLSHPLMPFKLPPPCWSLEDENLNKSRHWPFKRSCLGLQPPLHPSSSVLLVFPARSYEDLSSWHWNPELGTWCGTGTPQSSGRTFPAEESS
uniref:Uncharacterized protein n=1 Tax=Molossus molossus TaxID=27622 RepID=A0A7J8JVR0_MOLMO|nr:hypothetical protein HJG59_007970 [Molossus molossus]